jgi:hypothetical protein
MAEDLLTRIQRELQERATVLCFPKKRKSARVRLVSPSSARRRVVSPKVVRLMLAPRRAALERSGNARLSGRTDHADASSEGLVDEIDPQADLYERSL